MDVEQVRALLKNKNVVVGVVAVGLVTIGAVVWLVAGSSNGTDELLDDVNSHTSGFPFASNREFDDIDLEDCYNYVDVSGAVVNPGVHCVGEDAIVNTVINSAGGFAENACVNWIDRDLNRAELVEPNSKLYIPSVDDAECLGGTAGVVDVVASEVVSVTECVSINSASQSKLETLSGVGPSTAQKIIDGRPYDKIEDITDVNGIGPATLAKFKEDICL